MPTKTVNIRIEEELLEYLKERAEKENRTLSNMIVTILQKENRTLSNMIVTILQKEMKAEKG